MFAYAVEFVAFEFCFAFKPYVEVNFINSRHIHNSEEVGTVGGGYEFCVFHGAFYV